MARRDMQRVGTGFSEMAIEEGGAQPGLRFYDEADRRLLAIAAAIEQVVSPPSA